MKTHACDCSKPAYKHDGSGWFCKECEEYVKNIETLIELVIRVKRGVWHDLPPGTRDRREYWPIYRQRQKAKERRRLTAARRVVLQP